MTNVTDKIAAAHYVATLSQIESLAHDAYSAGQVLQRADGTYLRVLIVGCQSKLGAPVPKRRKSAADIDAQLVVLNGIHDEYYAAVLRGVTTPDVAHDESLDASERQRRSLERNRRSVFARTAKSTLATYVRNGGDIRTIVFETATKASLRPRNATPAGDRISRTHSAFIKAVTQRCTDNPEHARALIERAMAELRQLMKNLDEVEEPHVETPAQARRNTRTTAGEPVMR